VKNCQHRSGGGRSNPRFTDWLLAVCRASRVKPQKIADQAIFYSKIFKNGDDKSDGRYNIREENEDEEIIKDNIQRIVKYTNGQAGQYIMIFYSGGGNIDNFIFGRRTENGTFEILEGPEETRYAKLKEDNPEDGPEDLAKKRIGFIDRFIAGFIWEHDPRNEKAKNTWKWAWPKRKQEG
jgi:hypothetical protein